MLFEKIDYNHCGHLDKTEMQHIELDILKNVVKFCDKNNIKYILYYGTLLGAVREKGFIPWDDDVDIAMPREDYERFLRTYKDNDRYILAHIDKQKNYYLPFAKVYDNYTYLDERITRKFPMGVYIDIFPIDSFDKSKFSFYFTKVKRCFLHCKLCTIKKDSTLFYKILTFLGKIISFWFPLTAGIKSMAKNRNKLPTYEAKQVAIISEGLPYAKPFPSKCIKETIDWPFEDITVKIPKGYDEMLKILYGDYMTPPPSNKQKTAHETFYSGYKSKEEIAAI